jgi:hypothetical protein
MQTIITIIANLTVLVASILLIVTRVHGIFNKALWIAVVSTMSLFLIAYIATCTNKGRCEWTNQEFKEVLYCTIRPDTCTHLLPQLAGAAEAEYWKKRAAQHEDEITTLRRRNEELHRDRRNTETGALADRTTRKEADEAREEAERQRRIAEAADQARRRADEAREEAERQRRIAEAEAEQRRRDNEAAEELRRAEAEAAEERRQEMERAARRLTFQIRSNYPYQVDVSFYAPNSNRAWPGGSQVWVISDSNVHTYPLNCIPGEKICFGAWVRGNTRRYWGAGYAGRQGCTSCCYHCGGGETGVIVLNP